MVIDTNQLVLVEPEVKRIGWGIVKFVELLEVSMIIFLNKIGYSTYYLMNFKK